jgi:hypothetical protein
MHYTRWRLKGDPGGPDPLQADGSDGLTKFERYRLKDIEEYRKRKREQAKKEREKRRLYMQTWREANREKHNSYARRWAKENPERHAANQRRAHLKKKYGLSEADFDALVLAQDGKCKICLKTPRGRLHVDHSHDTGKIRGLLCTGCNTRLGWFEQYEGVVTTYLE